jgi:hypothetical protein
MWQAWERIEMHTELWLGDLGIDGTIILTCILERNNVRAWNVFIWLSIETSVGLL